MQIFVRSFIDSAPAAAVNISESATGGDLIQVLLPNLPAEGLYLSYGGKVLSHEQALVESGVVDCSTLNLGLRVRGGGGDGGATGAESRDCYLKMYAVKKPDKVDPNEARLARWSQCALSSEYLKPPCVIDGLGNVFNKEAIVHALLTKSLPKKFRYIRGLKDLITVHLTSIPGIDADDDHVETKFQCPVTGQEFNGKFKFVALRGCGHVLSARAFKEVQSATCFVCYEEFKTEDKIILNGTDEEVAILREKMEAEKASRATTKRKEKNEEVKNSSTVAVICESSEAGPSNASGDSGGDKPKKSSAVKRKDLKDEAAVPRAAAQAAAKKAKPLLPVPENATKEIYQSLFTSSGSRNNIKETYSCRALPLGRN